MDLVFKVIVVVDTVKPASMQAVTVAVTATVVKVKKASDVGRTMFKKIKFHLISWSIRLDSCELWLIAFLRHLCQTTICNLPRLHQENIRPVPPVTPKNHRYLFFKRGCIAVSQAPSHSLLQKTRCELTLALPKRKTPNSYCAPQHSLMIKIALLCNVQEFFLMG